MITYLYWLVVLAIAGTLFYFLIKHSTPKVAAITALVAILVGWGAYFFHFQQIFVKRYGGVMTVKVPDGMIHLAATWKDDNLWIENYDPEKNQCVFSEYSKGNLLEGRVIIRNCNPLLPGPENLPQGE